MKIRLLQRKIISSVYNHFHFALKKLKPFLLLVFALLLSAIALAQQTTVTGKVTNERGEPLADASINAKGTSATTTSDAEGNFRLNVPKKSNTLVVSFVGMETKEVTIAGQSNIQVSLTAAISGLSDVVVVGYGTQKKGSLTGAVSSIKSSDLVRTPSATTAGALVGKIAGVTARQTTGRPGAAATIQIRNLGTPLYVIDGVPQSEGQFNNIGLEDIENISVLKDASASIYGFRASNGVVLVTTKKGKASQKNVLNISSYYALQNVTRYMTASNAGDYVRALAEAEQNAGLTPTTTPEILEKWRQGTEKGFEGTDYRDFIIQKNAPQKYINVSTSGGTDKMNYYLSVGHVYEAAILKQYNFKRSNFQANLEGEVLKGLRIGAQLNGRIEARHNVASTTGIGVTYDNPFLAILTMWPTERLYANDNPSYINANVNNPSRNPLIYDENLIGAEDNTWNNFGGNFYTTLQLPFGLSAKATYTYNYKQNKNELYRKNFNTYTYVPATDTYNPFPFNLALRNKVREEIKENFAQVQVNYNKSFGGNNISALAAYEYATSEDQTLNINSLPPTNYSPIINLLDINGFADTYIIGKRASYIGRFNYDYKQRYLLEILGRYDGTSLYGPGKRFGLFPGISAGWRLSEESFIRKNFTAISNLKLRASWGRTGQERGVNAFDYLAGGTFNSGNYVFTPGQLTAGIGARGLPVTNITWVTSTAENIGIDIGLFRNKLTAEFDVFSRKLSGIPAARYDVLVPSEVGYTLPLENLNSEATRGIEGIVTYASKAGQVNYSLSANATLGRRKILDLYKPRYGNSWDEYRNRTANRWADINWGYHVIGQFQSVEQIKTWPVDNDNQGNRSLLPGDLIFDDVNGDGIISSLDERPIGYALGATPYMSFGMTGALRYKGFSLTTDWAGGTMQSYYRIFELAIPFQANHNAPEYIFNDRWHRADLFDPNSEWIPGKYPAIRRTGSGSHRNYTANSDFWITNVHYVRLKNLEIAYNLPQKLIEKAHFSNVRIYVNGTNLFSFDNVKDIQIDPEISFNTGLVYPNTRLYTFGINLTL
jgi:TonB-linked SusC/RagA family outer membrane protein